MAQLVEHVIGNDEVISSTLITSSKKFDLFRQVEFFIQADRLGISSTRKIYHADEVSISL